MAPLTRAPWAARLDVVVAICAAFGCVSSATFWAGSDVVIRRGALWAGWIDATWRIHGLLAVIGLALVFVAAWMLARGRRRWIAELVLCVALHVSAVLEMSARGTQMSSVEPLLIGQVLGARLVGRARARRTNQDEDVLARELACGVVGAAFFAAGIAKLVVTGPAWASLASQTLLVYERRESGVAMLTALRGWLVEHPVVVAGGAVFAWVTELAGPAFVFERFRGPWAVATLAAFGGLAVVLGIVQPTWMALPMALAFCRPPRTPAT